MQAFKTAARIDTGGELRLSELPFRAGEEVEVILLLREPEPARENRYPLRGIPIRYDDPTEPVSEGDWDALK